VAIRTLFVTSEMARFVKTGGLGEVAADLPRALCKQGVDTRILLPAYPSVLSACSTMRIAGELPGRAGIPACRIGEMRTVEGLIVYTVIAPSLYERGGSPYCRPDGSDWPDNDLRFGRLSLAAAQIGCGGLSGWRPDVMHVNDWPGGLTPAYLRWDNIRLPTILTLHNIAHQGVFPAGRRRALGIPDHAFDINGVEFHGHVSFLKAGLFYADHVCAVSPTYASEITTIPLGGGLHGLTRGLAERGQLSGIVNGIGESWNPGRDPHLLSPFNAANLRGKAAIADALRTNLCLAPSKGPLFGMVSRLVPQKGFDIVADAAGDIVRQGGQIVILGLGEPETEQMLNRLARRHRDHIGVLIGFNETMARRVIGGSDFFLMPSRFEPCGLTQMQAQRYGTLPIAHATGGLVDTIEDDVTGFLFSPLSVEALLATCRRAFAIFGAERRLGEMRQAAMSRRFGWEATAAQYERLYGRLTRKPAFAATSMRQSVVGSAKPRGSDASVTPSPVTLAI
jgi:starch synthase